MNWQMMLKADPIQWLLEPDNPSVRCWTLKDIQDRSEDDPDVLQARNAVSQQPLVLELFSQQHVEGHWGDDPTKPYTAEGTLGVLSLLFTLGVQPDERTRAGCDSFLKYCQSENGGYSMVKTRRSGIFPCTTGQHLPFLVYFGLNDDPRLQAAFAYLIEAMLEDDPLNCSRYQHHACLWGAIAALNGLAVLPSADRTPRAVQAISRLSETLLNANYDFKGEHRRWLTFGVPRSWDLLSAVKSLIDCGFAADPRIDRLLDLILAQQDQQGRLTCGSTSRTWTLEKRGQPSKWVTLDLLRVLKRLA